MHPTQKPVGQVELTPADHLRHAAVYLQRHGWIQGDMFANPQSDPTPAACAYGAIRMVVCGSVECPYTDDQARDVGRALGLLAGHLDGHRDVRTINDHGEPLSAFDLVTEWNDIPGRTKAQVLTACTAAANGWNTQSGGAE